MEIVVLGVDVVVTEIPRQIEVQLKEKLHISGLWKKGIADFDQ